MKSICKEFYFQRNLTETISLYLKEHLTNKDFLFYEAYINKLEIPECLFYYTLGLKPTSKFDYRYHEFITSIMNGKFKVPESIFIFVLKQNKKDPTYNKHYLCCAAKNETLSEKSYNLLYKLIRKNNSVRGLESLFLNPKFPLHLVEKEVYEEIKNTYNIKVVCKRPDATEKLLDYLFELDHDNGFYIAGNPQPLSSKLLDKLYETSSEVILFEMAKRTDLPKHLQKKLAKKHSFSILNSLLDNDKVHKEAIKIVSKKRIKRISSKAKNRLNHGNKN